jgi:hypothetical protein
VTHAPYAGPGDGADATGGAVLADDGPAPGGSGLTGMADEGLQQLRLGGKGRRANPGQQPPHLRDVVF